MYSPPRDPEAEAHFTGSQITMFDLQNFLLKRKTPAGLWLKKKHKCNLSPTPQHALPKNQKKKKSFF